MFFDLSLNTWTEDEMKAVLKVLRSGNFTMGEMVDGFEKQFAAKMGTRYAVMVNSGSSANLLALAALCYRKENPLQKGDEIIVPAVSWATTYFPLQQLGLKVKFVDIDLKTLNIDASKVEGAITPKTKAVIAVNLFGNPCQFDVLKDVCKRKNLLLLEDNCQGMGGDIKGRQTGTFGFLGTYSFFFSQTLSTMEGGMIVTEDSEIYQIAKSMRSYGWTRGLPPVSPLFEKREDEALESYRFILPGYNFRPLELCAAAGSEQLKKLEKFLEVRRQNATLFKEMFQRDERVILQSEIQPPGVAKSGWAAFSMILNPTWKMDRKKFFEKLRDNQIAFRMIGAGNFTRHDVIKYFDYEKDGDLLNADIAHDFGFYVGNYPQSLLKQFDRIKQILNAVSSQAGKFNSAA